MPTLTSSGFRLWSCGRLNPPNRRMRTRMSGGVAGEAGRPVPLCRFHPIFHLRYQRNWLLQKRNRIREEKKMSTETLPETNSIPRINDTAPDFTAETTQGTIHFHQWIGDGWAILFSHPKNFTPVCTTELGYMAGLQPEFAKRNCKVIGLSVDPVSSHGKRSEEHTSE